jgi:hypothetical protein
VVIGSVPGATISSVAGLITGVLDTIRRWFDVQSAARGSVNQVALQAAWIKGRKGAAVLTPASLSRLGLEPLHRCST